MEFNVTPKEHIKDFLNQTIKVRNAIILGNEGFGKSYALKEALAETDSFTITFSENFYLPFECIRKSFSLSPNAKREEIIAALSKSYDLNHCIVFENFEYCDADSWELIKQVIQFHNSYDFPSVSIFVVNCETPPDALNEINATIIRFTPLSDNEMDLYIQTIICADTDERLMYARKQLVTIAKGNLLSLNLAINILLQKGVFVRLPSKSILNYTGSEFTDNLFFLYMDLFKILDIHIQEALRMIIPLEDRVNISLLKETFARCKRIECYLDEISKYKSFIIRHQETISDGTTLVHYVFPSERAKEAVIESTIEDYFCQITTELYQHLEKLYQRTKSSSEISKEEYVYLLVLLTKLRNNNLTINHLLYYVELMQYYLECSSYGAVIKYAEQFLSYNILSIVQINIEQPRFFRIYFRALLALGQYNLIINYLNTLSDWDIKLLVAYAYYNCGKPQNAMGLCKELEEEHKCGEVFSLEAAIYDWLGDNQKSYNAFKKALCFTSNNDELKYSLYKKYSLYIDFELPECKQYLKKSLDYYETVSIRKYAETLHNYGTESVITFLSSGMKDLEKAREIFYSICEEEAYYPLNSLAIGYCIQEEYYKAIEIWEKIDVEHIEVDFCRLAILNNLFCAYIKVDNIKKACYIKESLSKQLNIGTAKQDLQLFVEKKPDIQHQIRQFLLNSALLELRKGNNSEALHYFTLSIDCSKYHSTMLYLIQEQVTILQNFDVNTSVLRKLQHKLWTRKLGAPGKLAKFYAQNKMYYCILMFWGDN